MRGVGKHVPFSPDARKRLGVPADANVRALDTDNVPMLIVWSADGVLHVKGTASAREMLAALKQIAASLQERIRAEQEQEAQR